MNTSKIAAASLAAVALAAAATGCGSSSSASGSGSGATSAPFQAPAAAAAGPVDVKLTEWAVEPSVPSAKAGAVTFSVTNAGKVPHEMVVLRTDKRADALGSGARVPEKGNVGEIGDLAAGATKTLKIKLAKGHYALVCNIAGHYSSGMRADFTVS